MITPEKKRSVLTICSLYAGVYTEGNLYLHGTLKEIKALLEGILLGLTFSRRGCDCSIFT